MTFLLVKEYLIILNTNIKFKNLPPNGEPKSTSIFIGELLYISCPSLNGEIKFGTPVNNFIGVAELNIKIYYFYELTWMDLCACIFLRHFSSCPFHN